MLKAPQRKQLVCGFSKLSSKENWELLAMISKLGQASTCEILYYSKAQRNLSNTPRSLPWKAGFTTRQYGSGVMWGKARKVSAGSVKERGFWKSNKGAWAFVRWPITSVIEGQQGQEQVYRRILQWEEGALVVEKLSSLLNCYNILSPHRSFNLFLGWSLLPLRYVWSVWVLSGEAVAMWMQLLWQRGKGSLLICQYPIFKL